MRSLLIAATTLMLFAANTAQAKVNITIDKDAQMMTVAVDGVTRYHWPVSSGIPSRETPNGTFRAFRMEAEHFSKEFDDAPMPHSIFFTKIGHAIHGTESEGRLGTPASHGCVRLSRANATTLYALVEQQGVLNTTVTLTGSATVALARNPRRNTAVARAEPAQPDQQYQQQPYQPQPQYQQQYAQPQYSDSGQPITLTQQPQFFPGRRPMQPQPQQQQADDGYIYPADGSSTDQRYPAPRRRSSYDGQAYYQQQPQPYGGGYNDPYQQQQRGTYYQPRGGLY